MLKKALYEKNPPRLETTFTNILPTTPKSPTFNFKRFKHVFVVGVGKYTQKLILLNLPPLKRKRKAYLINHITTFRKICYNFDVKTILGGRDMIIKRTIKQT